MRNHRKPPPPADKPTWGAHSIYTADLGVPDRWRYRRTPPGSPTVADLVQPGTVVSTSYGTGGVVIEVKEYFYTAPTRVTLSHFTIIYVPPDREELVVEALLVYAESLASVADTGDIRRDLVDFLVALAAGLETPFGRALEQAIQPAGHDVTIRALTKVLDQRVAAMQQRVNNAVDRGELPPVDSSFLGEMISGPVHLIINRGMRPFARPDAERIVDVVLAGIQSTGIQT